MGSGDDRGTVETVAVELSYLVEPLGNVATAAADGDTEPLRSFLDDAHVGEAVLGDRFEEVEQVATQVAPTWKAIRRTVVDPLAAGETPSVADIRTAATAIGDLFEAIRALEGLTLPHADDGANAADAVVDFLVAGYLEAHHEEYYSFCCLTGIVTGQNGEGPVEVDLATVATVLGSPTDVPEEVFGWGTQGFRAYVVVHYLSRAYEALFEVPALRKNVVFDVQDGESANRNVNNLLRAPLFSATDNAGASTYLDVLLAPVPGSTDGRALPGLALVPDGRASLSKTVDLGDDWTFTVDGSVTSTDWALVAQPQRDGSTDAGIKTLDGDWPVSTADVTDPDPATGLPDLHAEAAVTYTGANEGEQTRLVGGDSGGVYLDSLELRVTVDADDDGTSLAIELPTSGTFEVEPRGGFLSQVLPESISSDMDVAVGWSTAKGLYFEGGASLEIPIPIHEQLGPLKLEELFLSIGPDPDTGALAIQAAASASVQLGPIVGTVTRVGLETDVTFPGDQGGNLGVVDLEVGFKPPEGVGLDVAAGPISGGGYLAFDRENERYAGTGQLTFPSGLSIAVVGLITTELPDGSDGFSMMLIIAGEFSAVQLGFGFTLEGVGGLLGINRSFRSKPLQDVVRQGNLDSVLFPEDVVENAQRIISDVRAIFPPTRGTHVFGPMVKLGWGTPSIIAASLGVVLEIPSFRIALLGRIEMALPNLDVERPEGLPEEAPFPPIVVNLDVVGIVDIPGKTLSLDASMYDSRIVQWTMSGDMALRSSWGDRSRFLLSIGGFNPRYTPPDGFPPLDRVKVSLDVPGGQPVVDFTGYLAVTSNTFQVGARVHAELEAGIVYVYGDLGFDALFRFDPFSFVFDFFAHVGVEVKGYELSVGVDGTISGPTPFNIRGTAEVSVGPFDVSVDVDVSLGSDAKTKAIPTAEVLPELVAAFAEPKNWDAQLPGDGNAVVTLRSARSDEARDQAKQAAGASTGGQGTGASGAGDASAPVLAHPLGTLTVRQSVVPLDYPIEKFGEATPGTYDEFRIAGVTVSDVRDREREVVESEFAPAAYRQMDDAEKLETPDFVDLDAGTTAGDGGVVVGGEATPDDATAASFTYEEPVYDRAHDTRGDSLSSLDAVEAGVGHTAFASQGLAKAKRDVDPPAGGLFGVEDEDADGGLFGTEPGDFVVVDADTFTPVLATFAGTDSGDDDSNADPENDAGERDDAIASLLGGRTTSGASAEKRRPGLTEGTSKGRAQVELKRFAKESGVDETRLQVVSASSLGGVGDGE